MAKQLAENAEDLISPSYVNKLRSERNVAERKDKDPYIDIHKRQIEYERNGDFFISALNLRPFGCLMIPIGGLAILKDQNRLCDKGLRGPVIAKYDMTAGIVKSLPAAMDKSIVNHNFIIGVNNGQPHKILINLMEFATDTSNVLNLRLSMEHLLTQYAMIDSGRKLVDMVVTDHCWAAITALIEGLNRISKQEYFERSYEAFTHPSKAKMFFKDYILILICSSHTAKTLNQDLLKAYKKGELTREEYHFLAALLGHIYAIKDVDECDAYVEAVFALLCHKYEDKTVR
jgi:hypothetical protein